MPVAKNQEESNPCQKELQMSYQCLNENNFDREKCVIQFENYKHCKNFWGFVRSDRRSKGIYPYLPPVADREHIKKQYMNPQKD